MKLLQFDKIIDHVMIKWLFFVERRGKGGAKGQLLRYVEIFSLLYLTIRLQARVFYEQIVNEAQPS